MSNRKRTMTEVIMRRFNDVLKLLKAVRLNSAILVLVVVLSGALITPTNSNAQAVPPRVQSLMINRPVVLPPTPPLQKEIEDLRREVRAKIPPPPGPGPRGPQGPPGPPDDRVWALEIQIKKMEYQITVLEAELGRLRQELRRRPGR